VRTQSVSNNGVEVYTRRELTQCLHWSNALATERKDHRYYELVEDTMHPEIRGTRAEQSELEFGRGQLLVLFLRPRHYLVLNFRDPARP
jgi:hypothetical protein